MLHVDVDVVRTGADCERLFLHIFAVFVAQLVEQFHVLMGFEVRVPGEKEKKYSVNKRVVYNFIGICCSQLQGIELFCGIKKFGAKRERALIISEETFDFNCEFKLTSKKGSRKQ